MSAYQRVPVEVSASGNNTVIAAIPGKTIEIMEICLIPAADVTVKLISGTTDLTGDMVFDVPGFRLEALYTGVPHFVGGANEAFIVELGGAVQVGGWAIYSVESDTA